MTSLETALYEVLKAAIDAAAGGDTLFEVELLASVYDPATTGRAIRIGDSNFDLAPAPGGAMEELDVLGNVEILSRPEDDTPAAFVAAREDGRVLALAVGQALFDDPTLGGRVQDSRILGGVAGWGSLRTEKYRVVRLHVIGNETGAL
jgi:hypothetical protein